MISSDKLISTDKGTSLNKHLLFLLLLAASTVTTMNKYKHITKSKIAVSEINVAILYGISFETINKYDEFTLNPCDIVRLSKPALLPTKHTVYIPATKQTLIFMGENERYHADLITREKVVCDYLQTGIEQGEIRACILIGQKEIPLPIPQGNFFIAKSFYEQANKNLESQ